MDKQQAAGQVVGRRAHEVPTLIWIFKEPFQVSRQRRTLPLWPRKHILCQKSSQALFYSFPKAHGCFQPVCLGSSPGGVAKQPRGKGASENPEPSEAIVLKSIIKSIVLWCSIWIHWQHLSDLTLHDTHASSLPLSLLASSLLLEVSLTIPSRSSLQIFVLQVHPWMFPSSYSLTPWSLLGRHHTHPPTDGHSQFSAPLAMVSFEVQIHHSKCL